MNCERCGERLINPEVGCIFCAEEVAQGIENPPAFGLAEPPTEPHEFAAWLDGPELAKFVLEHHGVKARIGEADRGRVSEWAAGSPASVCIADRVLTALGRHLHELPAEVWLVEKPAREKAAA